jgi:hypothetical protein
LFRLLRLERPTSVQRSGPLGKQIVFGCVLTVVGAADLAGYIPPITDYAYGIVWWGVLLLVDAWNSNRRGLSLWRGHAAHFLTITAPVSVVVWLFFEAVNLPSPQWRYRGDVPGLWGKVLFGFIAFSTVVPIMVESWWLITGKQRVPAGLLGWARRYRWILLAAAGGLAVVPFINGVFWFNQGIWLIPALVLLPVVRAESCSGAEFARALVLSGLLAGLAWEAFNWPARTHWEYLILPDAPHLFYMPLPGYLGFIPFALSMMAVYVSLRSLRPSLWLGALLYAVAVGGLYWLTVLYVARGIWVDL